MTILWNNIDPILQIKKTEVETGKFAKVSQK